MTDNKKSKKDVREHWNARAGLGLEAGTQDVMVKQLEIDTIAKYIHDGMKILDIGCGNGVTAIEMARRHEVNILGIDFAEEMVKAANEILSTVQLRGSVRFEIGDVNKLEKFKEKFDLIYTERTLINLPDWPAQKKAIGKIVSLLTDGGIYVMCENSQDGLDKINSLRKLVGLNPITPPWHNRYFWDAEILATKLPNAKLEAVNPFSSTYYFLSRVVNAWLAAQDNKEPRYDAPVNQLALQLPAIGDTAQNKIWLWRKNK